MGRREGEKLRQGGLDVIGPFMTVKIRLYACILRDTTTILIVHHFCNPAEKGVATLTVNVGILVIRGNIRNDKNLSETSLTVKISTGK